MKVEGACHCGFISVEAEIDPEKVSICHCTDCQTISGSAFRLSVPVPGNALKMTGDTGDLRQDGGKRQPP